MKKDKTSECAKTYSWCTNEYKFEQIDLIGFEVNRGSYVLFEVLRTHNEYHLAEEAVAKYPAGWRYDWDALNRLVAADVAYQFWARVIAQSSPSPDEPTVLWDVWRDALNQLKKELINSRWHGTSTDGFSNARDRVQREFNSRMVRRWLDES